MTQAAELAKRRAAMHAEKLRRRYSDFFRAAWVIHEPATPLSWSWELEATCDHLQALVEDWARRQRDPAFVQRMRNLLVTKPPGTAKSRQLAYLAPWAWLRWPHMSITALSCNPRVSKRDSMFARDVVESKWYQQTFSPSWRVREDADAKGLFRTTAGGFRAALGFDARMVGERSDLVVIDDPHDPDEVESETSRNNVHDKWDNTISNRVNDLGSSIRVGICHRTHEDDWSSRRIVEGWAHLDLPMLCEPDRVCETPLGRPDPRTVEGECINPARFPPSVIDEERAKGERRWSTLYQGRPTPRGGAMVKLSWPRFWRRKGLPDAAAARPNECWKGPSVELGADQLKRARIVIAADLAGGRKTEKGDYNVIVAIARIDSMLAVLEVWRERADFPDVQRAFRGFASRYPGAGKYVEQAASGAPLVASLTKEIPGLIAVPTGQMGKTERLEAVLAFYEAGNVMFDEHATYLDAVITELTAYPNAPHDDIVDALSLGLAKSVGDASALDRWSILGFGVPADELRRREEQLKKKRAARRTDQPSMADDIELARRLNAVLTAEHERLYAAERRTDRDVSQAIRLCRRVSSGQAHIGERGALRRLASRWLTTSAPA